MPDPDVALRRQAYGEVIRMYRERAEISQLDLAKRMGYLPRIIRGIEGGHRDPHPTKPSDLPYERMADALGVTEGEIDSATRARYRQLAGEGAGRGRA